MAQNALGSDPRSLQELAVDVVTDIHKLATGLAHAGASPDVTRQIEQTSMLYSGIAKALASGPVGQQPAGAGPGANEPEPPAAAAPQPPMQAPQGNPIGVNSPQGAAYGDLHNTIAQMHKDSVNAVARTGR